MLLKYPLLPQAKWQLFLAVPRLVSKELNIQALPCVSLRNWEGSVGGRQGRFPVPLHIGPFLSCPGVTVFVRVVAEVSTYFLK